MSLSVTPQIEGEYEVKVGTFEGPLSLLLHLIKKNEVDIANIPIALITQQYLETLHWMVALDLTVAGEFLVMAATLLHIKSQMLLPVMEMEEEEDPRQELVEQLLAYQVFKNAADRFEQREGLWREVFHREPPAKTVDEAPLLEDVTLYDLIEALKGVLERLPDPSVMEITGEALSIQDRIQFILDQIETHQSLPFESLFEGQVTRILVIVTFLALLETVRWGRIGLLQVTADSPIRLFLRVA